MFYIGLPMKARDVMSTDKRNIFVKGTHERREDIIESSEWPSGAFDASCRKSRMESHSSSSPRSPETSLGGTPSNGHHEA